jgi:hypothetical protein
MSQTDDAHDEQADAQPSSAESLVAVNTRVRVHPGTAEEACGVVVEDYGDDVGHPVDIGAHHIADAARRWAVVLDAGNLVFVDDHDLVPE